MTSTQTKSDVADTLRAQVASAVLTAEDDGYAAALTSFNLALDHRPDLVLLAESVRDVSIAVALARDKGMRVIPVGCGHGTLDAMRGGLAIVTGGLAGVAIDEQAQVARIGAGTSWQQVLDATASTGLAALAGSSPLVGVVGYVLGGGLGPVARTFGYAADHVRSIELVDGTGRIVVADAENEPEVFWALRGGKGGFGIVTSVTLDLFPLPSLYAGGMFIAAADIPAFLHTWLDWGQHIPDTMSTSVAVLRLPPLPELPEPLRGQLVVHARVAFVGDDAEGEHLVAPLRSAAPPLIENIVRMPYSSLPQIHNDPVTPMPYTEGGVLLSELDHDGLDVLLAKIGPGQGVPLVAVELRQLGGALARQPQVPNAVPGRAAGFALHIVGVPVPELLDTVVTPLIQDTFTAMGPWLADAGQPNFVGRANPVSDLSDCWPAEDAARLAQVRETLDPASVFAFGRD